MYAEHARRQLDEQHTALDERLTGSWPSSSVRPRTREPRSGSRSASSTTSGQRERAHALAIEQDTRSS